MVCSREPGTLLNTLNISSARICVVLCGEDARYQASEDDVRVFTDQLKDVLFSMLVLIFRGHNGMGFTVVKYSKSDNKMYCKVNTSE